MSDSGFIVVRSDDGRFMDSTGCWRREYPEANVFPSLGDARTSVRKTFKGAVAIFHTDGYAVEDEPRCVMDKGRVVYK